MPVITLKINCLNPPVKRTRLVEWIKEMMHLYVAAAAKPLQSCPTLATPWTAAHQAPLSMGFSRQKYWSGVPLPSPERRSMLSYTKLVCYLTQNSLQI